jgi:hypothetical protein
MPSRFELWTRRINDSRLNLATWAVLSFVAGCLFAAWLSSGEIPTTQSLESICAQVENLDLGDDGIKPGLLAELRSLRNKCEAAPIRRG